jgi:hypothetical protein
VKAWAQLPRGRQCGTDSIAPKHERPGRIKPLATAPASFARYDHQRTAADLRSVFHKHLDIRGAENILFENDGI